MLARDSGHNPGSGGRPQVSVIVPARNEEASLGACLESLVSQSGVDFEVLVVDDGSTDQTRAIAQSFASVRIVDAPPLQPGWSGKSNALWAGFQQACGEWLLFTDADTVHAPGSLARSVAEAQTHGAALLSYSPAQVAASFWEKAILPVVFAELTAHYPTAEVNDPRSPVAAANGQYLLISREAYAAAGGHAAVATTLLEDVALAKLVKASGRRLCFRFGGDAVRTRMYRNFAQLWEGWTKNLVLLFPRPLRLAALRALEFLAIAGGLAVAALGLLRSWPLPGGIALLVALAVGANFLRRIRRAHFPWLETLLAVVGLPVFVSLLACSWLNYRWRNEVTWKGRSYAASRPQGPA